MAINDQTKQKRSKKSMIDNQDILDRYVIFELNNEMLALSLKYVQEVYDTPHIRKIPRSSDKISGVINLRGDIIPIINFHNCIFTLREKRLYTHEDLKKRSIIIIQLAQEIIGIIADRIQDIIELSPDYFENIPTAVPTKIPIEFITKIANIDGMILKIIDIEKVIAESLIMQLEKKENISTQPSYSSQKEFKNQEINIPERQKLNLSHDQLDALREITNIASGKAATAMGQLFKAKIPIKINVESAIVRRIDEMQYNATFRSEDKLLGIRALIKEDMNATIFLLLPLQNVIELLEMMENIDKPPKSLKTIDDLDDKTHSALIELGNIIISHYCTGISDFLKIQIYHDVPELAIDTYGAILDNDIAQASPDSDELILLQTQVLTSRESFSTALIFIPYANSIDNFIEWMDVDNLVELLEAEAAGKSPAELQTTQTEKTKREKGKGKGKKEEPLEEDSETTAPLQEIFSKIQFQKDYKLAEIDKRELKITDSELDTFRELGNIGAGNASNALSQMLNKKVFLEIPPAKVMTVSDLIKFYGEKNQTYIGYVGMLKGFLESNIFLLLGTEHVENVLMLIMESEAKKTLRTETDLSTNEKSAVIELLNILLGHYIAALADFLKVLIDPPEYQFLFRKGQQLFSQLTPDVKNMKAVVVETAIKVADAASIQGTFVMLLHPNIVQRIIAKIDEEWS